MADYQLKNVKDFDLAQTLECGQCFHFVKLDEEDYVLTASIVSSLFLLYPLILCFLIITLYKIPLYIF